MPDFIIEDPKTGNSWTIRRAPDEASAMEAFDRNRGKGKIPVDVQVRIRPPAAAPDAAIQTNEQGNFDIQESPNFPEMNVPGDPMGSDMLSVGPDEEGQAMLKDKTFFQQMDMIARAIGAPLANQFTMGRISAAEPQMREKLGPEASEFLLGDKTMDQMRQESPHLIGNLPAWLSGAAGMAAGPGKLLPESWLMQGTGAKGVAARTAVAPLDTAALEMADAEARGETASPTEGTGTSIVMQLLGEMFGKGVRTTGTKYRQKDMPPLQISEEKMTPTVGEWLKNVPYGPPSVPGADVRTQLGPDILPVIAAERSKAPRAYAELRSDAQARREGELGRMQATQQTLTGQTDTAAGQAQAFKDRALDPNISDAYTQALKIPFPNTSVQTKTGKMIVPIPFKNTLTSSPRFYDAWVKAGEGTDGGLARAEIQARKRGAQATKAEIAWHTIQKLNDMGDAGQELASLLKKDMGNFHPELGKVVKTQADLWQKNRGAALGDKIYTNPTNLDKAAHQVLTDPEAMQAAGDAFVARFIEDSSKGKLPKMTEQMRSTAKDLLGESRAGALFRAYGIERTTREIDQPLVESTAGISPEGLKKPPSKTKQAFKAVARVASGAGGGIPGMIGGLGPAAGQFLKDNPTALTQSDVEGLFSLLRKQPEAIKEIKKNKAERYRAPGGTSFAKPYVDQQRQEDRRRNRGQE